ncbi:MAG: hypothetical protein U5L04_07435 [Trueperaceae bacterium]|nr:hypothetical protein [Trueperaceae bacterium]
MVDLDQLYRRLVTAAQGGRVAASDFLDPEQSAELAARLRAAGVGVHVGGGYSGARRRVVTAFPEHIPEATTPLSAFYVSRNDVDEDELRAALRQAGIDAAAIGDVVPYQDGVAVVVLERAADEAFALTRIAGKPVAPERLEPAQLASRSAKEQMVVVPSLRVDALGAKAFGVSRAYFSKGIASGRVRLNGKPAGKSANADVGDEIYAEGLGRLNIDAVQGETKKGNLKVVLRIEKG